MCEMFCLQLQWESTRTPKSRHSFTLGNCTVCIYCVLHRLSNISVRQDATLVFSNLQLPFSSPPHKLVEVFLHSVTFGHVREDGRYVCVISIQAYQRIAITIIVS